MESYFKTFFILTERYAENCGCSLSASELHPPFVYIRRTTQQPFQVSPMPRNPNLYKIMYLSKMIKITVVTILPEV
jgi:hypothetical protein